MSDEATIFGELRSAVHVPSAENWAHICQQLDLYEHADALRERALPYLRRHLKSWPDALRQAPSRWISSIRTSEALPQLQAARVLVLDEVDEELLERLADHGDSQQITTLRLASRRHAGSQSLARALRGLMRSEALPELEAVELYEMRLGNAGVQGILDSFRARRLKRLVAYGEELDAHSCELLGYHRHLGALRELVLDANHLGDEALDALATSDLPGLELLSLSQTKIAQPALLWGRSARWPALRRLRLSYNSIDGPALVAMVRALSAGLDELDLEANFLEDEAIVEIAEADVLSSLEHLHLGLNRLGERARAAVASSPYISSSVTWA